MGTNSTPHGPTSLSALLDEAEKCMEKRDTGRTLADGFLFSGNRHESVPRSLFLDQRLTPLERNAWQVFRILLNDDMTMLDLTLDLAEELGFPASVIWSAIHSWIEQDLV